MLATTREALASLSAVLHQCSSDDLGGLVTQLDEIASAAAAVRTSVVAEAVQRGVVVQALPGWVRAHAPSLRQGPGASQTARIVTESGAAAPQWSAGATGPDPDAPAQIVWDAVIGTATTGTTTTGATTTGTTTMGATTTGTTRSGIGTGSTDGDAGLAGDDTDGLAGDNTEASGERERITTSTAPVTAGLGIAVLAEMRYLTPRLVPEAVPTVTRVLLDVGREWGAAQMRRVRARLLADHGQAGELDAAQERIASGAFLSAPQVEDLGLTRYSMALTASQAVTLEAVLDPLSVPRPNPETGEWDLRPAGQRRAEALTEACARAAAAAATDSPDGAAGSSAVVHVTIDLADLQGLTGLSATTTPTRTPTAATAGVDLAVRPDGCGEVIGSRAEGVLLSVETLRIVACEAALVPAVLGTAGAVLDQGMTHRLFTRAQRRALLRRDRQCTFPGCDRPGTWARAHHVRHWLDHGPTTLANAALLCERHHQVVHRRRLWATVRSTPGPNGRCVEWDLTDCSYDAHLSDLRDEARAARVLYEHTITALLDAADQGTPELAGHGWLDDPCCTSHQLRDTG